MRLDIPDYDYALSEFINIVIKGFIDVEPLLGQLGLRSVVHTGPIRNVRGENPLDQNMQRIEATSMISIETIRNTNFDEIVDFLFTLAQDMRESLTREFYKGIRELTDATGQVFDAKGEPLSIDHIINILEKMPIEFDENGKPILPTIVIPPEMRESFLKLEKTPDQRQRFDEIFTKKRAEYYAKQRTRRLS